MPDAAELDPPIDPQLQLFRLKDLPPAPGILQEAMRVISDEQADLKDVSAVIDRSPALVARILRCANSSYYGQRRRIVTVEEAIIRVLGLSTTKGLVLGMALSQTFDLRSCPNFDSQRHWFLAVVTADLAEKLAGHLDFPRPAPGTAYAAGLLHNLGLLALVHTFPQKMSLLLAREGTEPLGARIREEFGIDHHQAGSRLALRWGLPELFVQVVEHHQNSAYRQPGWQLVRLIGVARTIAEALIAESPPADPSLFCPQELAFPQRAVERAIEKVNENRAGLLDLSHEVAGKGR